MNNIQFKLGHYGVQLFFIISGFVIFLTINKVSSSAEFIYKRFLRLFPTFWLCIVLTFTVTSFANIPRFERTTSELLKNLTMMPSLLNARAIDGVYWSLFPELLFYAFILLIYKLKLIRNVQIVNCIWLILSIIFVKFLFIKPIILLFNFQYSFLFTAGISFYLLWTKNGNQKIHHFIILMSLVVCWLLKTTEEFMVTAVCFLIFYLFVNNFLSFLSKLKILTFLGNISYSFYLIHQFIGLIIMYKLYELGITNPYYLLIAPLIILILISWIITKYFEVFVHNWFKKNVSLYDILSYRPRFFFK